MCGRRGVVRFEGVPPARLPFSPLAIRNASWYSSNCFGLKHVKNGSICGTVQDTRT